MYNKNQKYNRNQAASQTSDCGNGQIATNVGCQNTDSQVQGDENSLALTSQQTFPAVEVTSPSPPPPPPEDKCQGIEGTKWDVTLLQPLELDGVPADSVLCLPMNDPLPSSQDATIVPPRPEGPQIHVIIAPTSSFIGNDCSEGTFVRAEVTSGTPPVGVELGDIVCVQGSPPP